MTKPADTRVPDLNPLAELARLNGGGHSEKEWGSLRESLAQTTSWIAQLMAVPTDGVPPTVQPISLPMVTRADVAAPSADSAKMLALAPDRQGNWYRVPRAVGLAANDEEFDPASVTGDE